MTVAGHEPIPSCADPNVMACVTCSEEADRCVPWPCKFVRRAEGDTSNTAKNELCAIMTAAIQHSAGMPYVKTIPTTRLGREVVDAIIANEDIVLQVLGIRPVLPYGDPTGGLGPLWTKDES